MKKRKQRKVRRAPTTFICLICKKLFKNGQEVVSRQIEDFVKGTRLLHKKCLQANILTMPPSTYTSYMHEKYISDINEKLLLR